MKNKEGKMIIIYGPDERNSIPYATLFIQKGYDNIFLLSGGIEEFARSYPEHCEGKGVQQLINAKLHEEIMKKDGIIFII
jgi:centrosomal protein CEP41